VVLARNTYRFALLLVGYGIASGIDDLGAYSAEGPALVGLGLGGVALLCGTLAHYAAAPADGRDDTARGPDGPGDPRDGNEDGNGHDDRHGGDATAGEDGDPDDGGATNQSTPGRHVPWGWY
jgi:hypothetical protein